MRLDAQHDIEVSRLAAAQPGSPLSADPNLRTSVHAGRDPDRQALAHLHAALAAALRTGALQQAPRTSAGWTSGSGDHGSEDGLLLAADLSGAAAAGAGFLTGAGLRPVAPASLAAGKTRDVDLLFDPGERLVEGDRQVVAKVVATVRALAPSATTPEERVEDVSERHIGKVDARTAAALYCGMAEHVVSAAPSWIG